MTLTEQEQETIKEIYKKNFSLKKTSKELGYSPNTIRKYVEEHLPIQQQNKISKLRTNNDLLIGTYIGLWMGDGTQYKDEGKYVIKLCTDQRSDLVNAFMYGVVFDLFGIKPSLNRSTKSNRAYLRFFSKFVYEFVDQYALFSGYKTKTVRLKDDVGSYSDDFCAGCVLGLLMSDGYFGKNVVFASISELLIDNMKVLFEKFGFSPTVYCHDRAKYGWNDLFLLSVSRAESVEMKYFLNEVLKRLNSRVVIKV